MNERGEPVPSAVVSLACPEHLARELQSVTAADGAFHMYDLGCIDKNCTLKVSSGAREQSVNVMDHCKDTMLGCGTHCSTVEATVVLP
ncbi:MAG: hypothetical protein HOW73_36465 [Polyangiaceae bacterium]|nr:hypothetical protein [Polyangiaceae bacterium]